MLRPGFSGQFDRRGRFDQQMGRQFSFLKRGTRTHADNAAGEHVAPDDLDEGRRRRDGLLAAPFAQPADRAGLIEERLAAQLGLVAVAPFGERRIDLPMAVAEFTRAAPFVGGRGVGSGQQCEIAGRRIVVGRRRARHG